NAGVQQQAVHRYTALGVGGNADAASQQGAVGTGAEGPAEGGDYLLHHVHQVGGVTVFLDDHRKLVAADATHRIGGAQHTPQTVGHLADDGIPGGVAEGIVDVAEVVQIQHQHRQRLVGAQRALHAVLESVLQHLAVAATGQGIV